MITHIYCKVIDNWGDAGVCWRLARYIAIKGSKVTLWIDQPDVLTNLKVTPTQAKETGVVVRQWPEATTTVNSLIAGADLIITAFGCDLPEPIQTAIASEHPQQTLWINLEYLSAEAWVETHHGLPSIKRDGSRQIYFMPGFTSKTAGLLGPEPIPVDARQLAINLGIQDACAGMPSPRIASVFAYPDAPFTALSSLKQAWLLIVPEGVDLPELKMLVGHPSISIKHIPSLTQQEYDALLSLCDLNFVRGEDSWVRAQWAAKPFIWQPYRQTDQLHITKLDAFLDLVQMYGFSNANAQAWQQANRAWSHNGLPQAITSLMNQPNEQWQQFSTHFEQWRTHLACQTGLVENIFTYLDAQNRSKT